MAWLHAVIDVPRDQYATEAEFWARVLDWPPGDPWSDHPELRSFVPPRGEPYLHLQEIVGAPRVHVDLESAERRTTVERAVALGAELVSDHQEWTTLHSPGGLPFCVLDAREREAPTPTRWPDGHRTRMVQVCIDSPHSVHDREVVFWRELLTGRWVDSPVDEFAGKWHDDQCSPLQLLFQAIGEEDGPVRAHLDHGTDDLTSEVRRVRALGAENVGPGRGWHTFTDPAGIPFCVTGNSPARTRQRDIG